jgi:ATP-dependent Clp protease ATP-binding subunit ClpC
MKFQFNFSSRRLAAKPYLALTSWWYEAALFSFLVTAVIGWSTLFFISAHIMLIGLTIIATSIGAGLLNLWIFARTYYSNQPNTITVKEAIGRASVNFPNLISFDFVVTLYLSTGFILDRDSLLRAIRQIINSPHNSSFLSRLQINKAKLAAAIEQSVWPKLTWSDFASRTFKVANKLKSDQIEPAHALGALLVHPAIKAQLRSVGLVEEDILFAAWWQTELRRVTEFKRRWWDERHLLAFSGIGLSWASGFTPFVDRFTRFPRGSFWDSVLYGHEGKVNDIINTLARQRQSNVLLVGDPGVGRLGIVRQLAWLIQTSQAHTALIGQRVLYINAGELIAQGTTEASQMSLITRALNEMERAGNIIVIIDGLNSILGETGEQRINLTDILIPFLASATVRVVVLTSSDDYHLRLKSNEEIIQFFEVVQVPSLSPDATLRRLALTIPEIERQSHLFIPYLTLRALIKDTASILPHIPFPERAYDFLEEAIVLAQNHHDKTLLPEHVEQSISRKIGVNLGQLRGREREQLLNLEAIMHRRMVNQDNAIKTLTHAMIRARTEVRSIKRPIGTFLFLGPTGVGKTETAKTLAESYFGSEDHMIRLDMSEFQGTDSVGRLIGSASQPVGRLTSLIADHPFTVLLLDEFEKASPEAHQLFLQVFDEGNVTDIAGRQFSFLHTIIIATSNAGAELIRQSVKDGHVPPKFEETLKNHILSQNILRPELLNRFDAVITYSPLSLDHIRQIAALMLRSLNKRLDAEHGVTIVITPELIEFLVSIGYHPEFGARPMNRAIQDTVEFAVAQKILQGTIQPGQQVTLMPAELSALARKT